VDLCQELLGGLAPQECNAQCGRTTIGTGINNVGKVKYLNEPGVVLVNKYAELKEKVRVIGEEMEKVKEALTEYARRESVTLIKGSGHKARVRFDEKLKFPGKNEAEREDLNKVIIQAGKWPEVSQLDMTALTRIIEEDLWDKELIDQVMEYGRIEETSAVYLSKLKEAEE